MTAALAAALLLHGLILLGLDRRPPVRSASPLIVTLQTYEPPRHAAPPTPVRRDATTAGYAAPATSPSPLKTPANPSPQLATTTLEESPAAVQSSSLADDARLAARREALLAPKAPSVDRSVEARLAQALRPAFAGERRIGSDLLKISRADGSAYCLRLPPPDGARWGISDGLSVPTNCP